MTIANSIAYRIKCLREETGLKQREFAENLGKFSGDHLAKMERGDIKEPKYAHIIAISRYCDRSIDYILTGKDFIPCEKTINQSINMETLAAKEAIESLKNCAKSIKKLDMSAVLGIKYYENELKRVDRDPEVENALQCVKTEMMDRMVTN